jgi:hypothetical protein
VVEGVKPRDRDLHPDDASQIRGDEIDRGVSNDGCERRFVRGSVQAVLFNRSSRQLVLTDAGSSYLAACKRNPRGRNRG